MGHTATVPTPPPVKYAENTYFNVATHNGIVTLHNTATGGWRTIRIRTLPETSNFAPGRRIVELLTGPDNTADYQGFAFVSGGRVRLWHRHESSKAYQWYAAFLNEPENFPTIKVHYEGRCRVCNHKLTTPESIQSGIGPVCAGRN